MSDATEKAGTSRLSMQGDELKALLAFGVISSFAVIFELSNFGVFEALFGQAPSIIIPIEWVTLGVDATLFALYVVLLTLALAFDSFQTLRGLSKKLESASNASFLAGALGLFPVGLVFVIRLALWLIGLAG